MVAGAERTPGAALLTLAGALRAGAGLVTWATDADTLRHAHALTPEIMLRLRGDAGMEAWAAVLTEGANSVVIGPGLGTDTDATALVSALLASVP